MSQSRLLPYNQAPKPREQRFHVAQPWETHYGPVSCKDYECEQYLHGWTLSVPTVAPAGNPNVPTADWVRKAARGDYDGIRRHCLEEAREGGRTQFTFPAGQPCFKATQHRWHVRPPLWLHDRGERRRTLNDRDFKDLFNEEAYKLERLIQRG